MIRTYFLGSWFAPAGLVRCRAVVLLGDMVHPMPRRLHFLAINSSLIIAASVHRRAQLARGRTRARG